jgi:hypothetical protein
VAKAMDLVVAVYKISEGFPRREIYSLTNQIRRAAVSVPSSIAEGQAHFNKGEFTHFLRHSFWPNSKLSYCWRGDWSIFPTLKHTICWIGFTKSDAFSAASSHHSRSQLHNSWYWVLATGY